MKEKTVGVCHLQIKTFGRIYTENSLAGFMSNIPHLLPVSERDLELSSPPPLQDTLCNKISLKAFTDKISAQY